MRYARNISLIAIMSFVFVLSSGVLGGTISALHDRFTNEVYMLVRGVFGTTKLERAEARINHLESEVRGLRSLIVGLDNEVNFGAQNLTKMLLEVQSMRTQKLEICAHHLIPTSYCDDVDSIDISELAVVE